MSLFNTIRNGLSGFAGSQNYTDIFNIYWGAYLMSDFDKNVQMIMFQLYRITDIIESCIVDVPINNKSKITKEKIIKEYFKQASFYDKNNELDIDNFQNAKKDWDEEYFRLTDTLNEWGSDFKSLSNAMEEIAQYLIALKSDSLTRTKNKGESAISFNELDIKSQNVILYFYKAAPILFRFCKLNILDIYNDTNRYNKIMADYETIIDKLNSYLKPFEKK